MKTADYSYHPRPSSGVNRHVDSTHTSLVPLLGPRMWLPATKGFNRLRRDGAIQQHGSRFGLADVSKTNLVRSSSPGVPSAIPRPSGDDNGSNPRKQRWGTTGGFGRIGGVENKWKKA